MSKSHKIAIILIITSILCGCTKKITEDIYLCMNLEGDENIKIPIGKEWGSDITYKAKVYSKKITTTECEYDLRTSNSQQIRGFQKYLYDCGKFSILKIEHEYISAVNNQSKTTIVWSVLEKIGPSYNLKAKKEVKKCISNPKLYKRTETTTQELSNEFVKIIFTTEDTEKLIDKPRPQI
jgi:hypothetical protein